MFLLHTVVSKHNDLILDNTMQRHDRDHGGGSRNETSRKFALFFYIIVQFLKHTTSNLVIKKQN